MDIKIHKHGNEINRALKLIEKFESKNKIKFNLEIHIDLDTTNCGYFNWGESIIYLNPNLCSEPKNSAYGYTNDYGISGVILHEFSHFLDDYYDLTSEYMELVDDYGHCYLNSYSKTDLVEELAEVINLYLTNPYLLKIINTTQYLWIKSKFKSPSVCSNKEIVRKWNTWNKKTKNNCKKRWKFLVENNEINYIKNS